MRAPVHPAGTQTRVGVSIGVVAGDEAPDELLRHADLALHEAKAAGKGRCVSYSPDMQATTRRRLGLERDLRRALEAGELLLQYQPIFRLATEGLVGVEALLRWRHPELGLLPPVEFIPIAEATRLIVPIGRWVLEEACRQAAEWARRWPVVEMGINVSGLQLAEPSSPPSSPSSWPARGSRPRHSSSSSRKPCSWEDVEATTDRLWAARDLGVQIAVDDFGTGYSSLQYLLRFPLDILKMPRAFVEHIDGPRHEQAVGRAILDLATSLRLRVVAEGIERPEQLTRLRELDCARGQGFLLARPLDSPQVAALLARAELDAAACR